MGDLDYYGRLEEFIPVVGDVNDFHDDFLEIRAAQHRRRARLISAEPASNTMAWELVHAHNAIAAAYETILDMRQGRA